ncbi:MAG: hypothetical protein ACO3SO_03135 [Luteolibacter sp.]
MSNSTQQLPDDLMNHFQGRGLKSIVVFTVIVHLVVILITSIPFMIGKFTPNDKLSEQERTKRAVQEANETLAKIAKTHGLQTQQLRSQMAGRRSAPKSADTDQPEAPANDDSQEGNPPKEGEIRGDSAIEQQLKEKLDPPKELPPVDNTEDLFK